MNVVILFGKMIKDVDYRMTQSGMSVGKFALAVQRKTKDKATGKYENDLINCIAFGKTADTIANYIHKGDKFTLSGHIQTGSYTAKDGTKRYTTDVIVDSFDFPAKDSGQTSSAFTAIGEEIDF